jgi:hypothetical protein
MNTRVKGVCEKKTWRDEKSEERVVGRRGRLEGFKEKGG